MIDQGVDATCILSNGSKRFLLSDEARTVLIEAAGDDTAGPCDGEEAVILLADLDIGCIGAMSSALQPEKIRPVITRYRAGAVQAVPAADQPRKPPARPVRGDNRDDGRRVGSDRTALGQMRGELA
jgi:hypothetical protein